AVTHVDYSARVQTVHRETNPLYHDLISRFHALTGCPVLVNTSFNMRSEPIICTPEDAFRCFMGSEIDVLAAGKCYLIKDEQDPALRRNYQDEFAANRRESYRPLDFWARMLRPSVHGRLLSSHTYANGQDREP